MGLGRLVFPLYERTERLGILDQGRALIVAVGAFLDWGAVRPGAVFHVYLAETGPAASPS